MSNYIDMVRECGLQLSKIPIQFITEEMCEIAVSNSDSLHLVPVHLRTYKVCLAAIKHCKEAKHYIPVEKQIGEIEETIKKYEFKRQTMISEKSDSEIIHGAIKRMTGSDSYPVDKYGRYMPIPDFGLMLARPIPGDNTVTNFKPKLACMDKPLDKPLDLTTFMKDPPNPNVISNYIQGKMNEKSRLEKYLESGEFQHLSLAERIDIEYLSYLKGDEYFIDRNGNKHPRDAYKTIVWQFKEDLALKCINEKKTRLADIDIDLRSYDVCLAAVKNCGSDYKNVPYFHKTMDLVIQAMKNGYIPEDWNNKTSLLDALKICPDVLGIIPQEFLTVELCTDAIRRKPDIILYSKVPEHLRTDIMKKYVKDAIRQK